MTDTALENAKALKDRVTAKILHLEQQLKDAKAELQRADNFIRAHHDFTHRNFMGGTIFETPLPLQEAAKEKIVNPKKEDVAEAVREIIIAHGRPMSRAELMRELKLRHIEIQGKDPDMVLSTMLWRMYKRVVRLGNHGYWVPEMPCAPVGYHPDKPSKPLI